jgi:hypothetical protein
MIMLKRILLGISAILMSCDSDNNPVDLPPNFDVYRDYVESVRQTIPAVRELDFTVPVKTSFMTRDKLKDEFVMYHRHYTSMTAMMKQLGFLPDSVRSIEPYILENYSGFPAAYYITGTDSLVVIDPQEYSSSDLLGFVAHEFTHALQDQNFNLSQDDLFSDASYSHFCTDFYIARRSVAEGDAMVAEVRYLIHEGLWSGSVVDLFKEWKNDYFGSLKTQEIPVYLNLVSNFPYTAGAHYVVTIWNAKSWNGVNQLYYANRPQSTAEIITGEKVEPYQFDYNSLIQNWYNNSSSVQIADDDNYGPVMLLALLKDYTDAEHAETALGWRGDRLLYVLADNAQWGKFVWSLRFNDISSAKYCMQGIDAVLTGRTLGGIYSQRSQVVADSLITYTTGSVKTTLLRKEETVFWVENVIDPDAVVSGIVSTPLAKRSAGSIIRINSDPEIVTLKKLIIDREFERR